jgi:hypothetical protein
VALFAFTVEAAGGSPGGEEASAMAPVAPEGTPSRAALSQQAHSCYL